jgi:hypothetical protein
MSEMLSDSDARRADTADLGNEVATALESALGIVPGLLTVPEGFIPQARDGQCPGSNPAEIPQTMDELGELLSFTYDLTATQAGQLNIPVVGSVGGGISRRVIIFEWTRYKSLFGTNNVECRYGYVIRFCLTVNKLDAQGKLNLPFLSAQAELGNIQASWLMQVRGLVGPKLDSVILPPQDLKVETFIIAKQSLEAAIRAISDPSTRFIPGILVSKVDPNSKESLYRLSAVRAFALSSLKRGRTGADTQGRLASTDPADIDAITEAYTFCEVANPAEKPSAAAREKASRLLNGISADV